MARDNNIKSAAIEFENWLKQQPEGLLILPQDVPIAAPSKTIRNLLALHVKSGDLSRISSGIYYKPKYNPLLGKVRPSLTSVAETIARRDGARIIPTGATALNQLGISTQIPMKVIYLTDGTARTVKLDRGEISFRAANRKLLAMNGKYSQLAVLALKELGQQGIDEYTQDAILTALSKENIETLQEDMKRVPAWMQTYFVNVIKEKNINR